MIIRFTFEIDAPLRDIAFELNHFSTTGVDMLSTFTKNTRPFVEEELRLASKAKLSGDRIAEFAHLENAHVIGQESTFHHVRVHYLMLCWAVSNVSPKEFLGQIFRVIGAATKTAIGLVPQGNTGGANISPFKVMPIRPDLAKIIQRAKGRV